MTSLTSLLARRTHVSDRGRYRPPFGAHALSNMCLLL